MGVRFPRTRRFLCLGRRLGKLQLQGQLSGIGGMSPRMGGHDIHIAHVLLSYAAVPPGIAFAFLSLWFWHPHIAGEQTEAEC